MQDTLTATHSTTKQMRDRWRPDAHCGTKQPPNVPQHNNFHLWGTNQAQNVPHKRQILHWGTFLFANVPGHYKLLSGSSSSSSSDSPCTRAFRYFLYEIFEKNLIIKIKHSITKRAISAKSLSLIWDLAVITSGS